MGKPPDFSEKAKRTLADRAGNMCSNPDCRKLTSGSAKTPDKAVRVGEAAHVFGARAGTARFDEKMNDTQRASTSNGIWLCRKCHKLIDDDPQGFPATLLFAWLREHETYTADLLRTDGKRVRDQVNRQLYSEFETISPLAASIVSNKEGFWEGDLSLELVNRLFAPTLRKLSDVARDINFEKAIVVARDSETKFIRKKMNEALRLVESVTRVVTEDIVHSWGRPGEPGDEFEILYVCRNLGRALEAMVAWEVEMKSVFLEDEDWEPVFENLCGAIGLQAKEIARVAEFLTDAVEKVARKAPDEPLTLEYNLVFGLPDDFNKVHDHLLAELEQKKLLDGEW